jgi:hypothetical protein
VLFCFVLFSSSLRLDDPTIIFVYLTLRTLKNSAAHVQQLKKSVLIIITERHLRTLFGPTLHSLPAFLQRRMKAAAAAATATATAALQQ